MHSIQFRLSALFVVIITATLAIFGMYGYYQLSHELDENFTQLQKSTISRLTISVPAPMWDMNTEACKKILEAEMLQPEIRAIQVFDAANQIFIGTVRDKEGYVFSGTMLDVAGGIQNEAMLYRQTDVMAGAGGAQQSGPAIGRVVVHFSRHRIEEALRANALRSILEVLAIDTILVLVLTLSLRMIFTPLSRLRDALHALAHQDNEDIKELPETQRNEFGEVVKGFNETQRKLKQVIERHRKAEEAIRAESIKTEQAYQEVRKAMEISKSKAESLVESESQLRARTEELQKQTEALGESKLLLQDRTKDLQNQVADSLKTRKAMLNILEDLEVSKKETELTMQKINVMSQEQVAIFESLTLGIAFVKERIILRGNPKLGELFGRPLDEMIGQTTRIWYKDEEEYLGIGASVYEDLKQHALHQREQELPRKDGSLFWCLFRVRAIDAKDISQGIVCVLEDITERKQAENELKERMEDLERFSNLTIDREEKMIQLKEEINTLLGQMGQEKKYTIVE